MVGRFLRRNVELLAAQGGAFLYTIWELLFPVMPDQRAPVGLLTVDNRKQKTRPAGIRRPGLIDLDYLDLM